jgi:hypothetical protein
MRRFEARKEALLFEKKAEPTLREAKKFLLVRICGRIGTFEMMRSPQE